MPFVPQGGSVEPDVFVRNLAHEDVDPDTGTLTLTIKDPSGSVLPGFPITYPSAGMTRLAIGRYSYLWTIPLNMELGTYDWLWDAEYQGATLPTATDEVEVIPAGSLSTSPTGDHRPSLYITPAKLTASNLGSSLKGKSYNELVALIRIASRIVERECTAPAGHSFFGGSIENEQHHWDVGNDHVAGSRRVWPFHRPIKTVEGLDIRVTQGSAGVVTFPPNQCYINKQDGYIELVSLSLTTASIYAAGLIPNIGLVQPIVELDYTYGFDFVAIDEELLSTTSGDLTYAAENQYWTEDPTIKVDGAVTVPDSIDRTEGTVTFATPQTDKVVTASYRYPLPTAVADATALVVNDVVAWTRMNTIGLQGLSGLRVLEVEIRRSKTGSFDTVPVNPAASMLLSPYKFRSFI